MAQSEGWACNTCTLFNTKVHGLACEMCGVKRQDDTEESLREMANFDDDFDVNRTRALLRAFLERHQTRRTATVWVDENMRKQTQLELLTQQLLERHDRMVLGQQPILAALPADDRAACLPPGDPIYVFVDWSNIYISAKRRCSFDPADLSIHVRVNELIRLVERGRVCKARVLAGSSTRSIADALIMETVWQLWRDNGYELHLQQRRVDDAEDHVDEMLQARIAHYLMGDFGGKKPTLVLLTGDGNKEKNTTSFPRLASFAARTGWAVEVWSWKYSLSRVYHTLVETERSVSVNLLDPFRDDITFTRAVSNPVTDDPYV